jgi:ABC-2 type transport system permease protein
MPIFDQGYKHWNGRLSPVAWRWLTITRHGVRSQLKKRLTKMLLATAMVPALALAAAMVLWALFEQKASLLEPLMELLQGLPEEIKADPSSFRVPVWSLAFFGFFQIQLFFSMLLVMLTGPDLISQDLRFNAIPLYFSRPLRRIDYFLGKLGVIAFFLGAVAVVPAVVAYSLGICFSFNLSVVRDTWSLLAGSLVFGIFIVISAGTFMLAISSLSRNSRYVGAIWMGMWIVTNALGGILSESLSSRSWAAISYTGNLTRLSMVLLDVKSAWERFTALIPAPRGPRSRDISVPWTDPYPWQWSALVLVGIFGLSLCILSMRVKSLDRLK